MTLSAAPIQISFLFSVFYCPGVCELAQTDATENMRGNTCCAQQQTSIGARSHSAQLFCNLPNHLPAGLHSRCS